MLKQRYYSNINESLYGQGHIIYEGCPESFETGFTTLLLNTTIISYTNSRAYNLVADVFL